MIAGEQLPEKRGTGAPLRAEEVVNRTEKKRAVEQMGVTRLDTLLEQNKFLLAENN
jgi:hypothetical protein